jgi:hypothetical protein
MKKEHASKKAIAMTPDAYAGFLRLLLTPLSKVPPLTPDVEAYLRYANEREPVTSILVTEETSKQAA